MSLAELPSQGAHSCRKSLLIFKSTVCSVSPAPQNRYPLLVLPMNPERPISDSPARTNNKRPGRTLIDSSSSSDPASSNNDNNDEDENERRKRLFGLFRKFDQGGTGILQLDDVHAMVKAIMIPGNRSSKMKTKQVASVILQSLDKDKSGGVDREEFVQWVTKGMSLCQQRFVC